MRMIGLSIVALLLAACSGISFENVNTPEGTYTLRSVNGQPLPVTLDDRAVALTVSGGVLTLAASGEWSEVLTGTTIENGQTVSRQLSETGRWTLRNPYVELTRTDAALAYAGSFSVISGPKLELQRPVRQPYPVYVYAR
jgi:hypothetical protein